MTAEKLAEILENHMKWLADNGGCRANLSRANLSRANLSGANLSWADLSRADLSRANLSGANLSRADLSRANLSGANLSGADLSRADLSWADLSRANLSGANLSGADLSWADLSRADLSRANLSRANLSRADLSRANLSGAKGLLDTVNFMEAHFERTDRGYIVYKTFGGNYDPPGEWKIEPDSVITETVNFDRCTECGSGINVAPLEWVTREYPNKRIWKCLIEWPWLAGVCVPYNTDGKIRCSRVQLLEVVNNG